MGKLKAAWHAVWSDPEPVLGCLETIIAAPHGMVWPDSGGPGPPARTPEEVRRVLVWLGAGAKRGNEFPTQALVGQIVAGHDQADPQQQERIRAELVSHLEHPEGPHFLGALMAAGRLPLPEAKPTLLRLLSTPLPGGLPVPNPLSSKDNTRKNSDRRWRRNGSPISPGPGTLLVAALAVLKDPRLESLFRKLLAKFEDGAARDVCVLELCREAAIGLMLLSPAVLLGQLPDFLGTDSVLLDRLAGRPEPEIRQAVKTWSDQRPYRAHSQVAGERTPTL